MSQFPSDSETTNTSPFRYDFVVFGATGFVGQILTRHLFNHLAERSESLSWAIAGRSEAKLMELKRSLGDAARDLPVIHADATNTEQLQTLCSQTRVVVSTVGPYALYGEPLVRTCVQSGTDYCDLTGEFHWIRRMIDKHESEARKSGARIVHCCGFDSVPSDMGVYFLQQHALQLWGTPANEVKMRVKVLNGGASGGTCASFLNLMEEVAADPSVREQMHNPYSLCPADEQPAPQHEVKSAEYDSDFSSWTAPFIMAMINERVVHRSNALLNYRYGKPFAYNEGTLTSGRFKAIATAIGIRGFGVGAAAKPIRSLMQRFLLPKPGEGPSPEAQRTGSFDIRFFGRASNGQTLRTKVTGDRDPGYGSTARMLGQAVISLARDQPGPGGFWTPATVFDERYIERLTRFAGLRFEVLPGE